MNGVLVVLRFDMEGIKYYERIFSIDNQDPNLSAEWRANDHRMAAKYFLDHFLNGRTPQDLEDCQKGVSRFAL